MNNINKNQKLVHIHTAENEIQANIIKGYLENHSIQVFIKPDSRYFRNFDFRGFQGCFSGSALTSLPYLIYVYNDKKEKTEELIKNMKINNKHD